MRPAHAICHALTLTSVLAICSLLPQSALGLDILVDLDPFADRFGSQIEIYQLYDDGSGVRGAFGIYDTGASVVTWSAYDQSLDPIPIKVYDGAQAEGIGGMLTGDVSQPGTIWAVGMQAVDYLTLTVDIESPTSGAAFAPGASQEHGVQLFVGTDDGSPSLPSLTGTPIHNGRLVSDPNAPNGVAARINMQWGIDLGALLDELLGDLDPSLVGLFQGLKWPMPNIEFVSPGTVLQAVPDDDLTPDVDESTTQPVRIPLAMYGLDNHADPGETITSGYNPFQHSGVVLSAGGATIGDNPSDRLAMLFDTGAALSIISTQRAAGFGWNLAEPEYWVEVEGAAGGIGQIPGFTLDSLELPVDDDGDGEPDGKVLFTNVPIFVYDVTPADTDPEEGLDGILGMNLFNTAYEILYNPFDPLGASVSLTFLNNPIQEDIDPYLLGELDALGLSFSQQAHPLGLPGVRGAPIPEPATWVLLAAGGMTLLVWRLRRRAA